MRFNKYYQEVVRPKMLASYSFSEPLEVTELKSIRLSFYLNNLEDDEDRRILTSMRFLSIVTGRMPRVVRSEWSNKGGRERRYIFSCEVKLRGEVAYQFMEYLIHVVFPLYCRRNGWPLIEMSKEGDYTCSIKDMGVFFRQKEDLAGFRGNMEIKIETTANELNEGLSLVKQMGVPIYSVQELIERKRLAELHAKRRMIKRKKLAGIRKVQELLEEILEIREIQMGGMETSYGRPKMQKFTEANSKEEEIALRAFLERLIREVEEGELAREAEKDSGVLKGSFDMTHVRRIDQVVEEVEEAKEEQKKEDEELVELLERIKIANKEVEEE